MLSAICSAVSRIDPCARWSIPRRCLDITVAEQVADHRLGLSERQRTGREAVTKATDGMSQFGMPGSLEIEMSDRRCPYSNPEPTQNERMRAD